MTLPTLITILNPRSVVRPWFIGRRTAPDETVRGRALPPARGQDLTGGLMLCWSGPIPTDLTPGRPNPGKGTAESTIRGTTELPVATIAPSALRRFKSCGSNLQSRPCLSPPGDTSQRPALPLPSQMHLRRIPQLAVQPPMHVESLSGLIERVTFFNEENGWAVLKVKAKGHRGQVDRPRLHVASER